MAGRDWYIIKWNTENRTKDFYSIFWYIFRGVVAFFSLLYMFVHKHIIRSELILFATWVSSFTSSCDFNYLFPFC